MADPAAFLRAIKPIGALLLVSRDEDLQAALACWPLLIFRRRKKARSREAYASAREAVEDLWAGVEVDENRAQDLLATPDALYAIKRVSALGLAYPDGTVHPAASGLIARLTQAAISGGGEAAPSTRRRRVPR